ncbi:MAG: discoidin domain-containing protein [Methylococcaceae bacterium]|jgi:hypothetical protein
MNIPPKNQWIATASSGDPRAAFDQSYSTQWISAREEAPWLNIDLGKPVTLGGLEIYWGRQFTERYGIDASSDGENWTPLCATHHSEGGQNVFAFPPAEVRFLRWRCGRLGPEQWVEMVEINLYCPQDAASVREEGRLAVLGHAPITLPVGESITVDFGYQRSPLGVLVRWGETFGTVFSVHLSDDGETFRELGRITTGNGDYDSFYWRITTSRYLRFTLHDASCPAGAVIEELKLRILNKDRMPIGQLERAAQAGRHDLCPQSLLGRQLYWTVLGEIHGGEEALFDEYGNLEPRSGSGQLSPLLRLGGQLQAAPGADNVTQTLAEGALPIPRVNWSSEGMAVEVTALAHQGAVSVCYRLSNQTASGIQPALVLALRPVQINPYWQHGGQATINAIEYKPETHQVWVNDLCYARFSSPPDRVTIVEFADGDVVRQIEHGPLSTDLGLRSSSGLLSAAFEFGFTLAPGESASLVVSAPLREGVVPNPTVDFSALQGDVCNNWREKLGPRRITLGDSEISDTVEAQTGLILVNATRYAFKPGPRNYDRTWIRDGASQALALLYAGLTEEARRYVLWYSERIYPSGLVPPILNPDGSINRGYGSDIEFDAQGEFVLIAADTYRLTRDRDFLKAIFEPVVRATRFIEALCARTQAIHEPESRFYGLVAPSISHEGYNKPSYSYWDNYFALSAWRNCAYLATEIGDGAIAAWAGQRGEAFAANLARSLRMTDEVVGLGLIPGSADREDADPTSASIAFEPCRVDDVLPADLITPTYDHYRAHLDSLRAPGFDGGFSPYEIRNVNAFVALGRYEDAFQLLADALSWRRPPGWRSWAEVVWGNPRVAEYIGDMPHTWIGAEFATAIRRMLLRENGSTLELFRAVPDSWWAGEGITLNELPSCFGRVSLRARRESSRLTVELKLSGPAPEQIVIRYPGARSAYADGIPCHIEGDLITAAHLTTLVIDF